MSERLSRGAVISRLVAVPVAMVLSASAASAADTAATTKTKNALGYIAKSTTAGKTCANCSLFKATSGGNGTCQIIPDSTVKAAGWCKSWAS